jgi:hypothetical protein
MTYLFDLFISQLESNRLCITMENATNCFVKYTEHVKLLLFLDLPSTCYFVTNMIVTKVEKCFL